MTRQANNSKKAVIKQNPTARKQVNEEEEEEIYDEEIDQDEFDHLEDDDNDDEDDEEDEEDDDDEEGSEIEVDEEDDDDDDDDVDFEGINGLVEADNEEEEENHQEDVVDDLFYDLYNLTVANYHPLKVKFNPNKSNNDAFESHILEQTTRAAQLLYQKLSTLPTENSDIGPVTILPNEITLLPRTYKIPEPKPETKWEKFAREKGIKKRKRERMIYDEESSEYKPRFGYKRIKNGVEDLPIVEVKDGQDPYQDPWEVDRKGKKERIQKNQKNQISNQKNLAKKLKKSSKQFDAAIVPGIPVELNQTKLKRGKQGLKRALQLVQTSTASMGRYDEMRPGEPARKLITKTKKNRDNFEPISNEKQLMRDTLRFVTNKKEKKAKGITNSLAAYEGILPDAPENRFKKTKGRGKGKSR